jgi:hypothetical protein
MNFWQKASSIDRRIVFIALFISVIIPLIFNFKLPNRVTKEVQAVYDFIENLPSGSVILMSFDHDTATLPEMTPMARALLRHIFSKGDKVIGTAFLAEGAAIGNKAFKFVGDEYHLKEGEDYVFLGYRPEISSAILGMGESIIRVYPKDYRSIPLEEIPLMQKVKSYRDIGLIISVSDNDSPNAWINLANARYHKPVAPAVTAVMATTYYPFLQENQIVGMVPGLKAAAEYEQLIDKPGTATIGMAAQSIAHVLIVLLVILGNIGYLMLKRRAS